MPRKYVPLSKCHPYHVGARCINREWFAIPLPEVWQIMNHYLSYIHHNYGIEILSFVLMSNHIHLICRQPDLNLSAAMNYFMRETSRKIGRSANRINQTWGSRHYKALIGSSHYYGCAYKYVYRNPVEAKICAKVEDYPYSTLQGVITPERRLLPLSEDLAFASDPEGTLAWLNTPPKKGFQERVRKALRHSQMTFAQVSGKPHPLEQERY